MLTGSTSKFSWSHCLLTNPESVSSQTEDFDACCGQKQLLALSLVMILLAFLEKTIGFTTDLILQSSRGESKSMFLTASAAIAPHFNRQTLNQHETKEERRTTRLVKTKHPGLHQFTSLPSERQLTAV